MPRYFTLHDAERLLPNVESTLRDALFHRAEAESAHQELDTIHERIRTSGGMRVNPGKFLSLRTQRDTAVAALKEALEKVEQMGVLVKDLEIGLIDFLSWYQEREVCLCWKLGETGIRFWHGVEEGFRGRKEVDQEFLEGHSADRRASAKGDVN